MDRKDFFKSIANAVGDKVVRKMDEFQKVVDNEPELSDDQKQFLQEYTNWLAEFQVFVSKRSLNPFNIENNKKLMVLSADAEKRKSLLETYMDDIVFSEYFNKITQDITELIT